MKPTNKFGNEIRVARKELSMSQYELAKEVGMHQTVLSRVENGKQTLWDKETILKICEYLGLEFEEVYKLSREDRGLRA